MGEVAVELLDYFGVADIEFKADLTRRISQLITKFAPNRRWHVDTAVELLMKGGSYVAEEEVRFCFISPSYGYFVWAIRLTKCVFFYRLAISWF